MKVQRFILAGLAALLLTAPVHSFSLYTAGGDSDANEGPASILVGSALAAIVCPSIGTCSAWMTAAWLNGPAPKAEPARARPTGTAIPPSGQAAAREPCYLLLICRETTGGIEILSSQIVPGDLKPAYRLDVKPQMAELLDENGIELTQAFYDVVRELRWEAAKEGSNELFGGTVPAPEVVFAVRVPYSTKAKSLRLSQINNVEEIRSRRSTVPPESAVPIASQDATELLRVPLGMLPRAPEVNQ